MIALWAILFAIAAIAALKIAAQARRHDDDDDDGPGQPRRIRLPIHETRRGPR